MKKNYLLKSITLGVTALLSCNMINAQVTTLTYSFVGTVNTHTGTIDTWTVPACVNQMTIEVQGAAGGNASGGVPGNGARMIGTFTVFPGQVLSYLVGKTPGSVTVGGYSFPGGGGASYVANGATYSTALPMIIGGGGAGAYSSGIAVGAPTTTTGAGSSPGTGGNGAPAGSCVGGGGGFFSSGGNDINYGFFGGSGFQQGGYGSLPAASYLSTYQPGGFGGGTAGNYVGSCNTFGGNGGGYNGGSAQGTGFSYVGNSGSSYNIGTNQSNTAAFNSGHGMIIFKYIAGPTISVTSGSICTGSSYTMVPSGASTYTFSSGSAIVSPTAITSYSVVGTSSLGCVSSNTAVSSVTVNALPTVTATTSNSLICNGQSAILTAAAAATSYTWNTGAMTSTTSVTPSLTTVYTASVTDANGCIGNSMVTVTIDNPTISASTPNSIICVGETAVLTVSTSATSYTWNTGATTISTSVSPTVTTSYTVNGTSAIGCTNSANVNVTVNACTGINELTASLISVYPNPNNGIVNISLTATLVQNSTLEIYDALGKLVVKQVLANELNAVNMSNLENGMYTFKVINNNKTIKIGKLIKQ